MIYIIYNAFLIFNFERMTRNEYTFWTNQVEKTWHDIFNSFNLVATCFPDIFVRSTFFTFSTHLSGLQGDLWAKPSNDRQRGRTTSHGPRLEVDVKHRWKMMKGCLSRKLMPFSSLFKAVTGMTPANSGMIAGWPIYSRSKVWNPETRCRRLMIVKLFFYNWDESRGEGYGKKVE